MSTLRISVRTGRESKNLEKIPSKDTRTISRACLLRRRQIPIRQVTSLDLFLQLRFLRDLWSNLKLWQDFPRRIMLRGVDDSFTRFLMRVSLVLPPA